MYGAVDQRENQRTYILAEITNKTGRDHSGRVHHSTGPRSPQNRPRSPQNRPRSPPNRPSSLRPRSRKAEITRYQTSHWSPWTNIYVYTSLDITSSECICVVHCTKGKALTVHKLRIDICHCLGKYDIMYQLKSNVLLSLSYILVITCLSSRGFGCHTNPRHTGCKA